MNIPSFLQKDSGEPNRLNAMLKELLIKQEPASTLKECLSCYSPKFLQDMAVRLRTDANIDDKEAMVEGISKAVLEKMPADILFDDLTDLAKYVEICEHHGSDEELDMFSGIFKYVIRGWMFFFTGEGESVNTVKLTMPDEIMAFVKEWLADGEKMEQAERAKKLSKYTWALDHLYGIYEKAQFVKIWNQYNDYQLTVEELEAFLKNINARYAVGTEEGTYVVSNSINDYFTSTNLILGTNGKEYYMPTEKDLDIYEAAKVDLEAPEYVALRQYLFSKIHDKDVTDDLLYQLEMMIVVEPPADNVMMLIKNYDVKFEDPADAVEFWKIYTELANSVRLWSRRGFKASETGAPLSYTLADVTIKTTSMYKKIGRNDTCPCGSGKKYKNCCGAAGSEGDAEGETDGEKLN